MTATKKFLHVKTAAGPTNVIEIADGDVVSENGSITVKDKGGQLKYAIAGGAWSAVAFSDKATVDEPKADAPKAS